MTLRTNARIAGVTFLVYIAAGIASLILARQPAAVGVLTMVTSFSAIVLGVTLYAITHAEDPDLALLALACRIVESIPGVPGEIYFAVASTIFAWLLLRGALIPAVLAWLGVCSSGLLVVILPIQRAGLLGGPGSWSSSITWLLWLPALVFELALAAWLIVKGVAAPDMRVGRP